MTINQFKLFATCAKGLEDILASELLALGGVDVKAGEGGASFKGDLALVYKANICLRTAVRVLLFLAESPVESDEALYEFASSIDWSNYMTPDHTLMVDSNVRDSNLTHSQFTSQKIKDAICDQFVEKVGRRPSVDKENPLVKINFHLSNNHGVISLDSSGDSLHKRGYRPKQWKAPLNEALAAGLIQLAGWNSSQTFWDPMCGSGTLPIEAATLATARAPGLTRKKFGFQGWVDFEQSLFIEIRNQIRNQVEIIPELNVIGSDLRGDSLRACKDNAGAAGVGHLIDFRKEDFENIKPILGTTGILFLNPPYGIRLDQEEGVADVYRLIASVAKARFPGWKLAVMTGYVHALNEMKMTPQKTIRLFNGAIPCKLYLFDL